MRFAASRTGQATSALGHPRPRRTPAAAVAMRNRPAAGPRAGRSQVLSMPIRGVDAFTFRCSFGFGDR